MTRRAIIVKAIAGELTWLQAADILGISARQLRGSSANLSAAGMTGSAITAGARRAASAFRCG